jgi:hypothetical protein
MGRQKSGSGRLHQLAESLRVAHGDVCENFAVDLDAGLLEPMYESAVGDSVKAAGGVDSCYPEPAEVALSGSTVPVSVLFCVLDSFFGLLIELAVCSTIALGLKQDFSVTPMRYCSWFNAAHFTYLPQYKAFCVFVWQSRL